MKTSVVRLALLLTSGLCSCQHPQPNMMREGRSSFEVLEPIARPPALEPQLDVQPSSEIVVEQNPAYLSERDAVQPEYPAAALMARVGPRRVTATIWFDEEGRATDVARSLRGNFITDEFSDGFFAAVEAAALRWRISPPRNIYYRRSPDGQKTYLRNEPQPTSFDVTFTFETTGQVRSGG